MTTIDLTNTDEVRLPRSTSRSEPQHLLSILLGDYWFRRTEHISSAGIVALLGEFGITEGSARQAVLRLHKRGVLAQSRSGRTTAYGFLPRTNDVTDVRLRHIMGFGSTPPPWDRQWTVVTLTVPENNRLARIAIQNELRELGMAMLQDGVWISPRDVTASVNRVLRERTVRTAHVFRAEQFERGVAESALTRAFDLTRLRRSYERFIERHAPAAAELSTVDNALVYRTRLMNEWLAFRTIDPELPAELWPRGWPRPEARRTFQVLYDGLALDAQQRFRRVLSDTDPDLADAASVHFARDFS